MKKQIVFLVKPHPPEEILHQKCPINEKYKYAWEPIALKIIADYLLQSFSEKIELELWHLITEEDDQKFLENIEAKKPDIIAFSEIDVLVNEVSRLAVKVKEILPHTVILVGGKQSSLLTKGDYSPFLGVDYGIRGDGCNVLKDFIDYTLNNKDISTIEGLVLWGEDRLIYNENTFSVKTCKEYNNVNIHNIPVQNHSFEEYISKYEIQASIMEQNIRTSLIYTGQGCPHSCFFCQSPVEYGKAGKVILTYPAIVAEEVKWLIDNHGVNNFFSLEPNLNLDNLVCIYEELDKVGIDHAFISGFIRPADVVRAEKKGILKGLVEKGVRILYIGLDIPLNLKEDIYNKNFSYESMMDCIELCKKYGIIVISTMIGSPELTKEELKQLLENAKVFEVAEIEVRLAIALRNTKYYEQNKQYLIHDPDTDFRYYDEQNYRYQTMQFPDKIHPQETYDLVNQFNQEFYDNNNHFSYILDMITRNPDTIPYFKRLYQDRETKFMPDTLKDILKS